MRHRQRRDSRRKIDRMGRVIDLEKSCSKLRIIDNEFLHAEQVERDKQQDEEEARRQVHIKRMRDLERKTKTARINRMKENRRIQRDICSITKEALGLTNAHNKSGALAIRKAP